MLFIERVCHALHTSQVHYALVGGHAVALHGAPRGTVDIDFVVRWTRRTLVAAEQALNALGLVSRLPIDANDVFDYRDEYLNKRNLIAWNFYNPSDLSEQVDLIINYDLKGRKTKRFATDNVEINVLNIIDLIDMKRAAGRPQDQADIEALRHLK